MSFSLLNSKLNKYAKHNYKDMWAKLNGYKRKQCIPLCTFDRTQWGHHPWKVDGTSNREQEGAGGGTEAADARGGGGLFIGSSENRWIHRKEFCALSRCPGPTWVIVGRPPEAQFHVSFQPFKFHKLNVSSFQPFHIEFNRNRNHVLFDQNILEEREIGKVN